MARRGKRKGSAKDRKQRKARAAARSVATNDGTARGKGASSRGRPKEAPGLLDRQGERAEAERRHGRALGALRELADYGAKLVPAALNASERGLGDLVVTGILLKQGVRMLDAFEVLTSQACTDAALLQSRALFECSIYIDWMLDAETENKARYYYVSNLRRERETLNDALERADADQVESADSARAAGARERLAAIDEFLAQSPYSEVNAEFDAARRQKVYDPPWHAPLGQPSVRSLARAVDRLDQYEVLYSQTSEALHASRYDSHITIAGRHVELHPVRRARGAAGSLRVVFSVTVHTYRRIVLTYMPAWAADFEQRYRERWLPAFMPGGSRRRPA